MFMSRKNFVIKTQRLTLRPSTPDDLESTHEYASDIENTKYMIYLPNETIEETKSFLERVATEWQKDDPYFYEYAIILNKKHIGAVSASLDENREGCELGWIIHKDYQGKGYAFEAAKAVVDFAVNELNVKKIYACCDFRNEPSFRLMEKLGLSLESDSGTRRYKNTKEDIQELMYSLKLN